MDGRAYVALGAALLLLEGCSKKNVASIEDASVIDAAPLSGPEVPSGRCKVSTQGVLYDMLYFFPERKEFLARTAEGVFLEPLSVTATQAGKVEFATKPWRAAGAEGAPTTQTGSLAFTGKGWSFAFSRYKAAECAADDFDLTYKPLTELGVSAGKWATTDGYSMTFLPEGQRFLMNFKGDEKLIYYRVLDKTDAGIVIGSSATPPSSAVGDIWNVSTLTIVGNKLNAVLKDAQLLLTYSASSDAGASAPSASAGTTRATAPVPPQSRGATLRQGNTQVNGKLPPEVVNRVVRQNFGRFRTCYDNGLKNNSTLAGKVTIKFVIDQSGAVSTAQDGGSDLPDQGVISCVTRAFGTLSFPQPEAGIVTVIYPIMFNPGD